jgi:hypothetical protein
MDNRSKIVNVKINQQQLEVLETLRSEGTFGDAIDDVILNVFRKHVQTVREKKE